MTDYLIVESLFFKGIHLKKIVFSFFFLSKIRSRKDGQSHG